MNVSHLVFLKIAEYILIERNQCVNSETLIINSSRRYSSEVQARWNPVYIADLQYRWAK